MCIIVDTNTFHKFKEPDDEDMEPVWTWLEKRNGKIAYSDIEKLKEEWNRGRNAEPEKPTKTKR